MNGNERATRTSGTTDRSMTEEVEVAIVGAGPTGLTLAVMLSGYGIRTVVGCDGGHSLARGALGIPFQGETYPQSFVLADVRMSWALPDDEVQLFFSPEGLVVVAPLPQGHHRVVATVDGAPAEPSLSDVQALLDARGPRSQRPRVEEVVWSSRFRVQHRIATRFREGGVFLCGDAAHVHSPAGGQGMNTGIQDAANLAWKLALVVRGRAPGSLLDSYERERRPVARGVVSTTDRLTRLATVRSPLLRRLRNALIPIAGRAGRLPRRLAKILPHQAPSRCGRLRQMPPSPKERRTPKQGILLGVKLLNKVLLRNSFRNA
jgi:2-polyprenyl-6-methoxyphenol hydroxylase-like FAD-dependent oxidoreductase